MQGKPLTRRQFIERAAAIAGGVVLSPLAAAAAGRKLTAVDQVTLGRTGLKLSRLGIGCGTNSGRVQASLGQDRFNRLIRYAYDQGITYIDIARGYRTHGMLREAIRGLPREKLFIQTKMGGVPNKAFENIEQYCKDYGVEYLDCLLVHCTVTPDWDERRKRVLDAMEKAKDKQLIRAHGVVLPVLEQVARMRDKGRGVIGMKLVGNGDFTDPADREKAMQFVMQSGLTDAVTVGFKSPAEVDETIRRMNNALATVS